MTNWGGGFKASRPVLHCYSCRRTAVGRRSCLKADETQRHVSQYAFHIQIACDSDLQIGDATQEQLHRRWSRDSSAATAARIAWKGPSDRLAASAWIGHRPRSVASAPSADRKSTRLNSS